MDDCNKLKLNNDETEALLVGFRGSVRVSQDNHVRVGNHDSSFKGHVKNLGVYLNATLTRSALQHISRSEELALFFARANMNAFDHCSKHFTGCQSKKG